VLFAAMFRKVLIRTDTIVNYLKCGRRHETSTCPACRLLMPLDGIEPGDIVKHDASYSTNANGLRAFCREGRPSASKQPYALAGLSERLSPTFGSD